MAENSQPKKRGPGRQFAKGVSGNPGGRPRSTLSKTLEKVLGEKYDTSEFTNEEQLCRVIVADAIKGDKDMRHLIWDRREGRAPQTMDVTTDGKPLPPTDLGMSALMGKLSLDKLEKLIEATA